MIGTIYVFILIIFLLFASRLYYENEHTYYAPLVKIRNINNPIKHKPDITIDETI